MNAHFSQFLSTPRTVWVTGASSGIGRALALQLAQAGHRVVISARNADALQEMTLMHPRHLFALPFDAANETGTQETGNRLTLLAPALDLAILNAGTCEYLEEGAIDTALVSRVMAVNFNGTVAAANIAYPRLKLAANPALYVVSSQVTTLPLTRSGAYGASKAALEYFFRCLRIDWMATGIFIGIIRPGFVKTPLTDRNDFSMPWLWTAEKAAQKILHAIDHKQTEITFPLALHAVLTLLGKLPHTWWATLAQGMRKNSMHKNSGGHRP